MNSTCFLLVCGLFFISLMAYFQKQYTLIFIKSNMLTFSFMFSAHPVLTMKFSYFKFVTLLLKHVMTSANVSVLDYSLLMSASLNQHCR